MKQYITLLVLLFFSLSVNAQTDIYVEDFDGPTQSVTSGGSPGWSLNTSYYASGTASYFSEIINPYDSSVMITDAFSTIGNLVVTLEFNHICKIEFLDAGEIYVSNDDGVTWTKLTETHYRGVGGFSSGAGDKFTSASYSDWLPGNPTAPANDTVWWKPEVFDISAVAANSANVRIMFMLRDLNGTTVFENWGWVVDDIRVWIPPPQEASIEGIMLPLSLPSGCGLTDEIIQIRIANNGGQNIQGNLTATFQREGLPPVSESVPNFIGVGDTLDYTFNNTIDMASTQDTIYEVKAWISLVNDPYPDNDTMAIMYESKIALPDPQINDTTIPYGSSVTLTAVHTDSITWSSDPLGENLIGIGSSFTTPVLYDTAVYYVQAGASQAGAFFITEICHFKTSNGAPVTGWPSYLIADDYIEITGVPNSDLEGFTLEQWKTSMDGTYTFPPGTVLSPDGTAIIAVGQLGSSVPSPANFYYHGNGTYTGTYGSATAAGRIIKDPTGVIIDAVGYANYTFPAAAGVTPADWSGTTPTATSTAGNRLEGPYTKDATNWINSSTSPQDPNILNNNVTLPAPEGCPSRVIPVTVNVSGIPRNDAGVSEIVSPSGSVLAGVYYDLEVNIKNYGVDTLTKVEIHHTINGAPQPVHYWTGNLPYDSVAGPITLGNYTFGIGATNIVAWTELPNDSVDWANHNDTAKSLFYICLAGSLTLGGPTADIATFDEFFNIIDSAGLCGNTVINILPGNYNEQLTFGSITGLSDTSMLTFRSSTGDPDDVVIHYNASGTSDNYVLQLNGAQYLRFEHLTFMSENATHGRVVEITGGSHNNHFTGNKIIAPTVTVNSTNIALVYSGAGSNSNDSSNVFRLNTFMFGSYGFYYSGQSTTILEKGTVIDSNKFIDQYYRAIELRSQDAPVITSNYIYSSTEAVHGTSSTYFYGMYLYYCQNNTRIEKNHIVAPHGTYGIYFGTCSGTPARRALVANNMVAQIGGFTFVYGIYVTNSNYIDFYHNSVNITSPTSNAGHAFFLASGGNIRLVNNIFANTGGAFCVRINAPAAITRSNYNNLYSVASTNWGWWNGTIGNLTMWKSASGLDTNSVSINPGFTSPSDLHSSSIPMDNLGTPLAEVPDDFDWDIRCLVTPDIGADEYTPPVNDLMFTSVVWPRSDCMIGSNEQMVLLIRNNGTAPVSTFQAGYKINDQPVVLETFNQSIPPQTTDTLKFLTTADLSGYGLYQITFFTDLPNDENRHNDTIKDHTFFNSHDFYESDYYTSFEIEDPTRGNYVFIDANNDNSRWHFFGGATNARTGMIYMGYDCNQSNAGDDWFFSRCFSFEANRTYELSFWYKTSNASYTQSVDVLIGNSTSIAAMTTTLVSLPSFNNDTYEEAVVRFTVPISGDYHFGFYAYSPPVATTAQIMACIDDMTIRMIPPYDAGVISIREPSQGCGLSSETVTVRIKNYGSSHISSGLTASYRLAGEPVTVTESVPMVLLSGDTLDYTFQTPVTFNYSNDTVFSLIAYTSHIGDTLPSSMLNDTAYKFVKAFTSPPDPVIDPDTVSAGNVATFTAISNDVVYWYDHPFASEPIATGNTFVSQPLFETTNFYAETAVEDPADIVSGTGTSTTSVMPTYGWNDYGWSATRYSFSKMGYIDTIGYFVGNTPSNYIMNNQRIYMSLVNDSIFDNATRPNPNDMEMVYNGSIEFNGQGWVLIPLLEPFFYDPDYSLMIYYENQDGNGSSGQPSFCFTSTSPIRQAIYRNQNTTFPTQDGILSFNRPNLRLIMREGTGCRSNRVTAVANVLLEQFDAGVSNVYSPPEFAQIGTQYPVKLEVKNYGYDPLMQTPVSYQLNNQTVQTQTWNGSLLTSETDTIVFPDITITPGVSTIKAWTSLPNDGVPLNDTFSIQFIGTVLQPLPFFDNFDSVSLFQPNQQPYTNWQQGTPSTGSQNSAYSPPDAWCTNLLTPYFSNAYATLTTQLFDFSNAVNANIGFWINYNTENGVDGVFVEYSTDDGNSWNILGSHGDHNGINWYNTANLGASNTPGWSGNSDGWVKVQYNLNQFSGYAALRFRFVFVSDNVVNNEGVCIDDFELVIPGDVDARLFTVDNPQNNAPEGSHQPVVVIVRNDGVKDLDSFIVNYSFNQGAIQSINWQGTLAPGATVPVTLPPLTIPAGFYNICAWVDAIGDLNAENDTLCLTLYGMPLYDVAAVEIVSPGSYNIEGQNVAVSVLLRNYGVDTITSIPVGYRIDGGAVQTTTYNGVLYPNTTDTVFFPNIAIQPGNQLFCAFTQLPGDFNPGNDTVCKMIYAKPLLDVAPVALAYPTGKACNSPSMQVAFRIQNKGADTIYFDSNPVTINATATGVNPHVFNPVTVNQGYLPPNAEANVTITNSYNMSQSGVYTFSASTSMPGDGDPANDNIGPISVGGVTSISSFPAFENFETGHNSLLRMLPEQYCNVSVTSHAANGSQYGLHFQGGNPLGWIGEGSGANATTYHQAWVTNFSHHAKAVSCIINASGLTDLKLRFDLKQTYSSGAALSWFRVRVNNQVIADQNGDSVFQPTTPDLDPFETKIFDLSQFAGTSFTLTLEASNRNPFQYAGTAGDNAFVDNVMIFVPAPYDAGVSAIIQPGMSNAAAGTQVPVEIRIENFGTNTITSCQVGFQVGNNPPVLETWTGSLPPNGTTHYTFNTMATVLSGPFTIKAFTNLTGDVEPLNDTSTITFLGIPVIPLPWTDNMDGVNYWVAEGNHKIWQRTKPEGPTINYAYNGVNVWVTNPTGFYPNNANEFVISPYFDFSNVTDATLRFHHWVDMQPGFDGGQIQYTLNNGQTWPTLGFMMDPNGSNWYTDNISGVHCFSGLTAGYVQSSYDLSFLNNHPTPVRFRFRFFSDASVNNYDGWAIDNFAITLPTIPTDGGVSAILSPANYAEMGTDVNVEVRITNYGTDTLYSIPVSYRIDNYAPVGETWTGTLAPMEHTNYTFSQTYKATVSSHKLCAYTSIPGDTYAHNDTTCAIIYPGQGAKDVAIKRIIYPKDTWPTLCDSVKIVLENKGYLPINTLDITYYVNQQQLATEQWNGSLSPGDSMTYTFNQTFTVPLGSFIACVDVFLADDVDSTNNTLCKTFTNCYSSIDENDAHKFVLHQNIPNPSNGNTTINFQTGSAGTIKFFVVDLIGRPVMIREIPVVAGNHSIELYRYDIPPGFYLYGIEFNGKRLVRKMIINE